MQILLQLVIILVVMGVIVWLIGYLPIPEPFRRVIFVILALFFLIWLVYRFGLININ